MKIILGGQNQLVSIGAAIMLGVVLLLGMLGYQLLQNAALLQANNNPAGTTGTGGAQGIVQEAMKIEKDLAPPTIPGDGGGSFCTAGTPISKFCDGNGRIQCVGMVLATYTLAGYPLPLTNGNAVDYWKEYTTPHPPSGWTTIANGSNSPPLPGDIMVMDGGSPPYGHVAIVSAVNASSITVAQANWTDMPTMQLAFSSGYHFAQVGSHHILGFIRNVKASAQSAPPAGPSAGNNSPVLIPGSGTVDTGGITLTDMQSQLPNSPDVKIAWDDAQKYGYNPVYFLQQINLESGFNQTKRSADGRVGIAQLTVDQARSLGLNVLNPTSSSITVDERLDPAKALDAAARLLMDDYLQYLGIGKPLGANKPSPDDQAIDQSLAYEEAIAVTLPDCGDSCLNNAVQKAQAQDKSSSIPNAWKEDVFYAFSAQVQNEIITIMSFGRGV